MIKVHFQVTPCNNSLDSNVYLKSVQRVNKDLVHKPEGDEIAKHDKLKTKRSLFISPRCISLSKLDRTLLQDLVRVGSMTQEAAVNVLLACKREISAGYCDPTHGETRVGFHADRACFGDNRVTIEIDVKGRKEMPDVTLTERG